MGKIAFVFSGQGAQYPGMGREIFETSKAARDMFAMADSIRPGTSAQCFGGSKDELALTLNTQPCMCAVSLAHAAALRETGVFAQGAAGFSVGEISALGYCGAVTFETAFRIVCRRAELMHACAVATGGRMMAVIKMSGAVASQMCDDFTHVFPACYNYAGQTVVAGEEKQLVEFAKRASEVGARCVRLETSGAFHTPFMTKAGVEYRNFIDGIRFETPDIPHYLNITGEKPNNDYKDRLAMQIYNPVMWEQTVRNMVRDGFDTFVEVGVKRTLCDFIKKTDENCVTLNVENREGLEKAAQLLGGTKNSAG